MGLQTYSQHSFYPFSNQLKPVGPLARFDLLIRANRVNERINLYLEDQADRRTDYRVGIYGELGRGTHADALVHDLICFLKEQKESGAQTYWAVFYDTGDLTDEKFQEKALEELTCISSAEPRVDDKGFYFNFGDAILSVFGLHKNSRLSSRQFYYTTLVFSKSELPCLGQTH